jgi:hypothetical protein
MALRARMLVQRAVELQVRRGMAETLEVARGEQPPLTTRQPERAP